jgi:hypothetical protein
MLEHFDEFPADDAPLLLWIGDAGQLGKELIAGIDVNHFHAQAAREGLHHLFCFAQPQQPVVDENAGELVADGAVDQRRRHRGVDPAGQAQDDFVAAHLGADLRDRFADVVGHVPVAAAAADVVHEALDDLPAFERVGDLWVELQSVETAGLVGHPGDRRRVVGRDDAEPRGQRGYFVAVAHPHVEQAVAVRVGTVFQPAQQAGMASGTDFRVAELPLGGVLDRAAEFRRHDLHAVTNAQNRDAEFKHGMGDAVGFLFIDRIRAAGEDDP